MLTNAPTPTATPSPVPLAKDREQAEYWREQEMLLMREVMRAIGKSLTPQVVLREMLHLLSELLGLNRGRIVLADRVAGDAAVSGTVHYAYGLTRAEMARGQYAAGEGITGRVLSSGRPMIVQDIDAEPAFLGRMVERARLPPETVAFIAVPIEESGRTIGVLGCHRIRSRPRALTDDLAILRVMATLIGTILQLANTVERTTAELKARNELLARGIQHTEQRHGIVGDSPALLHAVDQLERVAATSVTVLLLGESGTGKELFARALHVLSPRKDKPFIKVNCAAIPETLFESELFGHERGAYTGANVARAGWFEQAHGGTIFLDEIGEVPLPMQAKLLRTLQESVVVRLGAKREQAIDVRVVAATHKDLDVAVREGSFRADLYYRLNVIPIRLPSLRERPTDIGLLATQFVSRANQAHQRQTQLSEAALRMLETHAWPGNIRELSNLIERLVVLSRGPVIDGAHVQQVLLGASAHAGATPAPALSAAPPAVGAVTGAAGALPVAQPVAPQAEPPRSVVREYRPVQADEGASLLDALARAGGNKSRAAQALGMTARQFAYRLEKLRLAT